VTGEGEERRTGAEGRPRDQQAECDEDGEGRARATGARLVCDGRGAGKREKERERETSGRRSQQCQHSTGQCMAFHPSRQAANDEADRAVRLPLRGGPRLARLCDSSLRACKASHSTDSKRGRACMQPERPRARRPRALAKAGHARPDPASHLERTNEAFRRKGEVGECGRNNDKKRRREAQRGRGNRGSGRARPQARQFFEETHRGYKERRERGAAKEQTETLWIHRRKGDLSPRREKSEHLRRSSAQGGRCTSSSEGSGFIPSPRACHPAWPARRPSWHG